MLRPGVTDHAQIDLLIGTGNETVKFSVTGGSAKVHITGYEVLEETYDGFGDDDDSDDDEDDDEFGEVPGGDDDDSDDDDDDDEDMGGGQPSFFNFGGAADDDDSDDDSSEDEAPPPPPPPPKSSVVSSRSYLSPGLILSAVLCRRDFTSSVPPVKPASMSTSTQTCVLGCKTIFRFAEKN